MSDITIPLWLVLVVTVFVPPIIGALVGVCISGDEGGGSWYDIDTRPLAGVFGALLGFAVSLIVLAVWGWVR